MPVIATLRKGAGRFFPQSIFWRFLLATLLLGILTASVAMFASWAIGRDLVFKLQEESGYTVLRNAVDLIGRTRIAMDEMRAFYISERKESLENVDIYTAGLLDSFNYQVDDEKERLRNQQSAYAHLNAMNKDFDPPFMIIDADYDLKVHPDPAMVGKNVFHRRDAEGAYALRNLVIDSRMAAPGESVFSVFYESEPGQESVAANLAAALYYKPWDVTICATMPMGDIAKSLHEKTQAAMNELRARISEIVIARTGYVYIFDNDCRMISHPTLTGEDFSSLLVPGAGDSLCGRLKKASILPWGENKLLYEWDRPEDKDNYVYPKISWCTREPTTGWYVATSAYAKEMEASLPKFIVTIFLPALFSIILLGCGLALLLRTLLRPIHDLTAMCRQVSKGDLTAKAREDAPGEMGFLCRQFNAMVRGLNRLRQKDVRRREELESLNKNLERIVGLRTSALERKARKLVHANERLKELDAMKSAFLSSVSHELRTPLTSIMGFAKLISKDFRKLFERSPAINRQIDVKYQRIQDNVGIIVDESERLTRLINDFLDLSKIESGRVEWKESVFGLHEITQSAAQTLASQFQKKPDVTFTTRVPADLPPIKADRDRLTQVMLNLVDNALKFTREGAVSISACADQGWIQVSVSDTGMGMRRQVLQKVFDKFHQATAAGDTLLDKPKGTGLGLAICHNIIAHYGGLIWAESELGRGTSIIFEIPARPDPVVLGRTEKRTPKQTSTPLEAGAADLEAPLILVVDDDPAIRSYLGQLFESEGYRALTAADGRQALDLAAKHPVDCITMDLMMPVMDGRTAIALLRGDPTLSSIPVVVVSILADRAAGGPQAGADASISKPIDEAALLRTVNGLLRDAQSSSPCMVVSEDGAKTEPQVLLYCPEHCGFCAPADLPEKIEEGFSGMVFIPAPLCDLIDVAALSRNKNVQIVVVPL